MSTANELFDARNTVAVREHLHSKDDATRQAMAREILSGAKLCKSDKLVFLAPLLLEALLHTDSEVCEAAAAVLARLALQDWPSYETLGDPGELRSALRSTLQRKHHGIRKSVVQVLIVDALRTGELALAREVMAHPAQKVQLSAITSVVRCATEGVSFSGLLDDLLGAMGSSNKKVARHVSRTLARWIEEGLSSTFHDSQVIELRERLAGRDGPGVQELRSLCDEHVPIAPQDEPNTGDADQEFEPRQPEEEAPTETPAGQRDVVPLGLEEFQSLYAAHQAWLDAGHGGCDWEVELEDGQLDAYCGGNTDGQADLSFRDLAGLELRELNLRNGNLLGVVCRNQNLSNSDLGNCCLAGGDFRGSDFSGADLSYARLDHANLTDCRFEGAVFEETCFDGATATGARFDAGVDLSSLAQAAQSAAEPEFPAEVDWAEATALGLTDGLSPSNRGDFDILYERIRQHRATQEQGGHRLSNEQLLENALAGAESANSRLENGYTPLCLAIDIDNVAMVEALLKAGADPNQVDDVLGESMAQTPLMWTVGRNPAIFEHLIAAGADPNGCIGDKSVLDTFIDLSGDVPDGCSLVRRLLAAGADPTRSTRYPLVMAVVRGANISTLAALLEAGAPVNDLWPGVGTALHAAVEDQLLDVIDLLIDAGADKTLADEHGVTPLAFAEQSELEDEELLRRLQ